MEVNMLEILARNPAISPKIAVLTTWWQRPSFSSTKTIENDVVIEMSGA
ncbi:MAG: hypothetical protein WCD79_04650 [Chthoniobacteraceae bacterium]